MEPTQSNPTGSSPKKTAAPSSKRWLLPVALGLVVVALAVGALMIWQSMNDTAEEETPSARVSITDNGFSPATIRVKKGQDVTWTNASESQHGVTSDQNGPNTENALGNGDAYSYVFDNTGTYTYRDQTNGSRTGVVIVE